MCLCRHIEGFEPIENRTGIYILQHRRERFHHIGTAKIAQLGLSNVQLDVAIGRGEFVEAVEPMPLPPGTGLLFPSPTSKSLEDTPVAEQPENLLLLDGTWAHAKKLYQRNPWLSKLPHYHLTPREPSRYRIRREPSKESISTIEAIIVALRILEPEINDQLDMLMALFERMIDNQLEMIFSNGATPRHNNRRRPARIPVGLTQRSKDVVLAYGRTVDAEDGTELLAHWVGLKPQSGEIFERFIRHEVPITPDNLSRMNLTPDDLASGVTISQLQEDWNGFIGDSAIVSVWNRATLDLLFGCYSEMMDLKSVYCNMKKCRSGSLDLVIARESLLPSFPKLNGIAAQRIGQIQALYEHLRVEVASH